MESGKVLYLGLSRRPQAAMLTTQIMLAGPRGSWVHSRSSGGESGIYAPTKIWRRHQGRNDCLTASSPPPKRTRRLDTSSEGTYTAENETSVQPRIKSREPCGRGADLRVEAVCATQREPTLC